MRHVATSAIKSLVIGKTPMTATGRASLLIGVFTGSSWLYNAHLDRKARDIRAKADREAADMRAKADRDAANIRADNEMQFRIWKARHDVWAKQHKQWENQSRFMRGAEPKEPIFEQK